jgi:Zn-finger nucleic acid-binding protein
MRKHFCPCAPKTAFDRCELTPGLLALRCPACQGVLLAMADYRRWRERQVLNSPAAEPIALPGQEKSSPARACPLCQRVMARYRTGSAESFWLDYCPVCQLVWLDDGEWRQLEESGFAPHLDIILTERWQQRVKARTLLSFREEVLVKRFGEETLAEIRRLKTWLDAHPRRKEILVYLNENIRS